MYNNDLVKISAREHVLNVKVKTSGDVQPGEIAICKQEREKLGVDEGESISIRHFSEAEKAEYFSEILSKVDFLSTFPTRDLIKLAKNIRREEYRPEEVVCREHERGDSMYIIESGRVEVWIRTRRGNKRRIAFLERGSFFGEISLLTGQERTATVSCITPTILLVIEKKPFQEILLKNQTRVEQISEIINQRVRETSQKRKKAEAFEEEHLVSFQARKPTNLASRIKQFFGIK
jgi:CRP-like cAMP-binding protein